MASNLRAQPFIDQLTAAGEAADIYMATSVGAENPATGYIAATAATGQDANDWIWRKVSTTVLVITTNNDRDFGDKGFYPKGSVACRVNANIFADPTTGDILTPLTRIVLTSSKRIKGASVPINRTPATLTDALTHPFVESIGYVRAVDTVYPASAYTLTPNSNAALPFAPDSIAWTSPKPTDSHSYGVTYRYHPLSNLLMDGGNMALTGVDGLAMPITCVFDRVPVGG